jgi:hypothetical protein
MKIFSSSINYFEFVVLNKLVEKSISFFLQAKVQALQYLI